MAVLPPWCSCGLAKGGNQPPSPPVGFVPAEPDGAPNKHAAKPKRVDPLAFESVKEARTIIGSLDHPVSLSNLFEAVRAKGFHIETNNPKATYGARLRDHSKRVGLV